MGGDFYSAEMAGVRSFVLFCFQQLDFESQIFCTLACLIPALPLRKRASVGWKVHRERAALAGRSALRGGVRLPSQLAAVSVGAGA